MIGYDFEYCGKYLRDFGFIMAKPDTEDEFGLNREIIKGTITPNKNSIPHFGVKYSDVLTLNIFIIKNVIEDKKNVVVSFDELRDLQAWLTSTKLPSSLKVESYDGNIIEYNGIFTSVSPFYNNKLNGLKLTFSCDSQYGYENQSMKISNASSSVTKTFYCSSDELNECVYPTITILPKSSETFKIENLTDGGIMALDIPDKFEEIMIDCKLRRIIADGKNVSLSDVGWNITPISDQNEVNTGTFKIYWLGLKPGYTKLKFTGNGSFKIECKSPIKVGGFISNV